MKVSIVKPITYVAGVLVVLLVLVTLNSCKDDDKEPINEIIITETSPSSPATLKFYETDSNDRVLITFDYNISLKDGARIFIRPRTNGDHSPGYIYSSSPVYKGKGTKTVLISIEEGPNAVNVDQLLIRIYDHDVTETVVERFENVDFTFSD